MADWQVEQRRREVMREYPNLCAVLLGCTSGRLSEWPSIPVELRKVADELIRLREALAAQNSRNWWQRLFDYSPEREPLYDVLATVAGVPCRFCFGPGNSEGACPDCGKPPHSEGVEIGR